MLSTAEWYAAVLAALSFAMAGIGFFTQWRAWRRRSRRLARITNTTKKLLRQTPRSPEWHESCSDREDRSQEELDGIVDSTESSQDKVFDAEESQTSFPLGSQVFVRVPDVRATTYWYAAREIAQLLPDDKDRRDFLRPKAASWQMEEDTDAAKSLPDLHVWLQRFKKINMSRKRKLLKAQKRQQLGRHMVEREEEKIENRIFPPLVHSTRARHNFLR